jgi:hypothetical protein
MMKAEESATRAQTVVNGAGSCAVPRQARVGSSLARVVLPDSVIDQHPPASTDERPITRLVKARPVRGDSPPSPQSQEALQMLPASGIVCTVHRLPVLRQERLMLAIRQDAEDTLTRSS